LFLKIAKFVLMLLSIAEQMIRFFQISQIYGCRCCWVDKQVRSAVLSIKNKPIQGQPVPSDGALFERQPVEPGHSPGTTFFCLR
jgi:hypothetical protein